MAGFPVVSWAGVLHIIHVSVGILIPHLSIVALVLSLRTWKRSVTEAGILGVVFVLSSGVEGSNFVLSGFLVNAGFA